MIEDVERMFALAREGEAQGWFFFGAVYLGAMCLYSATYQWRTSKWPSVTGRLRGLGVEEFGAPEWAPSDRDYVAKATYTYSVDGVEYVGRRLSPWGIVASSNARGVLVREMQSVEQGADGAVRVFYDPKRPAKSFLVKAGTLSQLLTLSLGAAPAVLYCLRYCTR